MFSRTGALMLSTCHNLLWLREVVLYLEFVTVLLQFSSALQYANTPMRAILVSHSKAWTWILMAMTITICVWNNVNGRTTNTKDPKIPFSQRKRKKTTTLLFIDISKYCLLRRFRSTFHHRVSINRI